MVDVKEGYWSTNKEMYNQLMLKYNDWCTSLHNTEQTLLYVTFQGWNDIDSGTVLNLLPHGD